MYDEQYHSSGVAGVQITDWMRCFFEVHEASMNPRGRNVPRSLAVEIHTGVKK
jgi:hypothetical protein